jgi:membrane-bound lytic murein transglycosylase D
MIPADRRASWRMHKVAGGDTLASIARRYGMAPGSIAAANGLKEASPAAGEPLLIPVAYRPTVAAPKRVVATHRAKGQRKRPAAVTHSASNRASRVSRAAGE